MVGTETEKGAVAVKAPEPISVPQPTTEPEPVMTPEETMEMRPPAKAGQTVPAPVMVAVPDAVPPERCQWRGE